MQLLVRGTRWRDYFLLDGHWYESSPSCEGMTLGPLWITPEALSGYSDPPAYTGPDRYDNVDLLGDPLLRFERGDRLMIMPSASRRPNG